MGRSRAFRALAACVLLAVPGACAGPSTDPPDGVSVSLQQWRTDPVQHTLQVAVRNQSSAQVHFADVQLITDSFRTLPPQRVDSTLARTPRTDFEIAYGRARCRPDGLPEVARATVVAHVRVGDEPMREVRFPIRHPDPLLAELLQTECTAHLIRRSADIGFGDRWRRSGGAMLGELVVHRTGGGKVVTVQEIGNTTHFRVRQSRPATPAGVLTAGQAELRLPVRVTPSRCDPHAFADAKQGFLFPVWVALDDAEPQYMRFTPPKPLQKRMLDFAREACGL